ncbi:MAG: hypothetical protein AAB225_21265 [Acidobacteriota bacterium]
MAAFRKKTWLLGQRLIDRVRRICRVRTETEALTRAMEEVALRPFEAGGRVVAADHRTCLRAGAVLSLLGTRFGLGSDKRRAMTNDVLIVIRP